MNISDFLNKDQLQMLVDTIYEISGIYSKIISTNGEEIASLNTASPYCALNISGCCQNNCICLNTQKFILKNIQEGRKYVYHECDSGLINIGIPITIQNECVAVFIIGHFLTELPNKQDFEERTINSEDIYDIINTLPVLDSQKEQAILKFISSIVSIISNTATNQLNFIKANAKLEQVNRKLVKSQDKLRQQYEALEKNEELLKRNEAKYKLALLGSSDGIWEWDFRNRRINYSEPWYKMLGYNLQTNPELTFTWKSLIHPEDIKKFEVTFNDYINKKNNKYHCEYRIRKKNGSYIWISDHGTALWDRNGRPVRMAGSHADITERKNWEETIYNLAYKDSLTDLANRTRLYIDLKTLSEKNKTFSIAFFDLDNFKSVNDTLGHSVGDLLLRKIAEKFTPLMSDTCLLYRWGGDEFVFIFLDPLVISNITSNLTKIIQMFEEPIDLNGKPFYVSASMGASTFPTDAKNIEDLIKNADTAMYSVKNNGKDSFQIFNKDMATAPTVDKGVKKDLKTALFNKEFIVLYQPRIEVSTNKIIGMEIHTRWVNKDSIVMPKDYIHLAEEIGVIDAINEYTLKTACEQTKRLHDIGFDWLNLSFKVSTKQLIERDFVVHILKILSETGFPPNYLELQIENNITEEQLGPVHNKLTQLHQSGIKICLDDFGSGYSSMDYIRKFPVDYIKFEPNIAHSIKNNDIEKAIIKSLIGLAHDLNIRVVIEDIETKEQLNFVQQNKCDEIQGPLIYKPMDYEEFENFIRK